MSLVHVDAGKDVQENHWKANNDLQIYRSKGPTQEEKTNRRAQKNYFSENSPYRGNTESRYTLSQKTVLANIYTEVPFKLMVTAPPVNQHLRGRGRRIMSF